MAPRLDGHAAMDLRKLTPSAGSLLLGGHRQQTFALKSLARGLSAPANGLALLPRSALGRLLVSPPALHLTEEAFALEFLFQDPEGLIDIVFTNENFQNGLLSS
jgi:hypothetical protein